MAYRSTSRRRALSFKATRQRPALTDNFKLDYDISADGDRFLMLQTTGKASAASVTVIANWQPKKGG